MLTAVRRLAAIIVVLLLAAGHTAAAQYQNGIPVLLYHHVNDDGGDMPELTTSPAEFDRQMGALKDAGFETITADELLAYMRGEAVALPAKPIALTFDDGYEDNYTYAFPILKKYGYKAAIFMVGINFDRPGRLSGGQIREMAAGGFTVGGHSMTHPDLRARSGAALREEVAGSKAKAERATGREARYFAYPGGFYNLATVEAVATAGYRGAFTVLTGLNKPGGHDAYFVRRIPVFMFTDFDRLLALLNANAPKTSLLQYDLVLPQYQDRY